MGGYRKIDLHLRARIEVIKLKAAFAFLFLSLLIGCVSRRPAPPPPPGAADAERLESLNQTYPLSFKMVQRVVLTVRGKQYDFIGYLRMRRADGSFRALALGEMGGVLFDILQPPGAAPPEILKKPDPIPSEPLRQGVARDLAHLFGGIPSGDGARYVLSPDGERLIESSEYIAGRLVRSVVYDDYRTFPGLARPAPARVTLENRQWRYRMEIELLEIEPIAPDAQP